MKQYLKLSTISLLVSSLFLSTTASFAGTCNTKSYDGNYSGYSSRHYKNEGFYKGQAPARHYKRPAYVQPCSSCLLDGLYLGGAIGYDSYKVRRYLGANDGAGDTISGSSFINAPGVVGGAFLGYGYYINLFYIGAELWGNSSNAITSTNSAATASNVAVINYYSKFTVRGSYGVSLLPGVKIADTSLLYGRVGYNRASIRTNETLTLGALGGSTTANTNTGSYRNGWSFGLGLESLIYENWSIRAEYTHAQYGPINTQFGNRFIPSDNQVMLGVLYHFTFC